MPPRDRATKRNVWIYNAATGDQLGGLYQAGSITQASFISMVHILIVAEKPVEIRHRVGGYLLEKCNIPLAKGEYDLSLEGSITLSDEPWVPHLITHATSGRDGEFRAGVRERDGKCVMSGVVNLESDIDVWDGFDACHIVPLHLESWFKEHNYGRWITDEISGSKINSPQNGLLLSVSLHQKFNSYTVSVDPDDGYKIVCFSRDSFKVDGRVLDPVCINRDHMYAVPDQLLRWHFRQSVLANMRGAGEPIFEHDFPPGTDQLVEMQEEPMAQLRFEILLADRSRGHVQPTNTSEQGD
ncbi:hypothetical protein ABW21_db0205775 [Orbilia brochopaga]|nr:hypothetical protein ABW21_db0205775 [Drechslerella brochopaga]